MSSRRILATKVYPTIMVGEDLDLSTRNLKTTKKPPHKSIDCDKKFKKYVTDDTTDVVLKKDYTGNRCEDLTGLAFDELSLPKYTILLKTGDKINAKRIQIESTNHKLDKISELGHKSGAHKATYYNIQALTICSIKQEELNIFKNKNIDKLRELKSSEVISKDGYLEIES